MVEIEPGSSAKNYFKEEPLFLTGRISTVKYILQDGVIAGIMFARKARNKDWKISSLTH